MIKLELAFLVGFVYVVALFVNQAALQSSVPLVVLPLWLYIALRCVGGYVALLFLAHYMPGVRDSLLSLVRDIVASERSGVNNSAD